MNEQDRRKMKINSSTQLSLVAIARLCPSSDTKCESTTESIESPLSFTKEPTEGNVSH